MELPLEVVAVAQGPGAIDGVDGEDVPRGAPAPEVAAPAAVAVPDVVVVGRVEGRGDGGAPAPNPVREASELLLPEAAAVAAGSDSSGGTDDWGSPRPVPDLAAGVLHHRSAVGDMNFWVGDSVTVCDPIDPIVRIGLVFELERLEIA